MLKLPNPNKLNSARVPHKDYKLLQDYLDAANAQREQRVGFYRGDSDGKFFAILYDDSIGTYRLLELRTVSETTAEGIEKSRHA